MSNLIIQNSNELEEISELYKYLSIKLNTERLDEKQVKIIQHKLYILNENLCTIHENIEDILTNVNNGPLTKDIDDQIKYREKINNICSEFYPLIIMKILSQKNI
tara:strand:- start:399 stop:713 length:315 start_codon:yes stop_codon:yes gene_type:complete